MKTILVLLAFMTSVSAYADKYSCIEKLTQNFSTDSVSFVVDLDSITVKGHENDSLAQGVSIIRSILNLNGCDGEQDINFGWSPLGRTKSSCQLMVPKRESSEVCYIESSLGYFIVTKDLQTTAHVIFNRWD